MCACFRLGFSVVLVCCIGMFLLFVLLVCVLSCSVVGVTVLFFSFFFSLCVLLLCCFSLLFVFFCVLACIVCRFVFVILCLPCEFLLCVLACCVVVPVLLCV